MCCFFSTIYTCVHISSKIKSSEILLANSLEILKAFGAKKNNLFEYKLNEHNYQQIDGEKN